MPIKPGYQTTEFWLTVVTNLITLVGAIKGLMPVQTAAIIMAGLNFSYATLRTLAKEPDITTLIKTEVNQ